MDTDDLPLTVSWFENPTVIARAIGLQIELPDPDHPTDVNHPGLKARGLREKSR